MTPNRSDPLGSISIDELKKQVGFKLVLPSYLPEGLRGGYRAHLEPYPTTLAGDSYAYARISLWGVDRRVGGLEIDLTERPGQRRAPPESQPTPTVTIQVTTIGHTIVECDLGPSYLLETPPPLTGLPPALTTALADPGFILPMPIFSPQPTLPPPLATIFAGPTVAPERQPYLDCEWNTEELDIEAEFDWTLGKPVPGLITPDMRDEAMKVVTSMIEDPYIPEAAATLPLAPTAPATDTPIPAATVGVQLSPTDTAVVPPTPVTPGPLGCGDCKVRQRDQLPVSAQDIQMDPQGKYFIPDRGDGCRYAETYSGSAYLGRQEVTLWAPGCEQGWTFLPATGELIPMLQ